MARTQKGHRGLLFCAHAVSHYEVFIIQALSGNMTVCFNSLLAFRSHTKESILHSFVCLLTSTHNTRRSCSGQSTMQLSLHYIVNIISTARSCSLTASSMNVNAEIFMFAIVPQSVIYYSPMFWNVVLMQVYLIRDFWMSIDLSLYTCVPQGGLDRPPCCSEVWVC